MLTYPQPTLYTSLWHKYRPVILKLMVESANAPQQYKLSAHEFRQKNPKEKNSHPFILYVYKCKALNNIKSSALANDLLLILQQSKTAKELTDVFTYEFMLDKHFVLHVKKAVGESSITTTASSSVEEM